jgi:ribosome assembly protein YihI (activator of Der GTPase)
MKKKSEKKQGYNPTVFQAADEGFTEPSIASVFQDFENEYEIARQTESHERWDMLLTRLQKHLMQPTGNLGVGAQQFLDAHEDMQEMYNEQILGVYATDEDDDDYTNTAAP